MKEFFRYFRLGLKAGIPICLGYFAVSFAMGIAAKDAGLGALPATIMSLTCVTSTGQYAAITLLAGGASYLEMAITQAIVNMRYLLMSTALTQKLRPGTGLATRLCLGYCMTDELFGISVAFKGYLQPSYTYGATVIAVLGWCAGTCLGVLVGNILPARLASALSVALFGMFIAIMVPPAKVNKVVAGLILVAMAASFLCQYIPVIKDISSGFRIIILTVAISGVGAFLFPAKEYEEESANE